MNHKKNLSKAAFAALLLAANVPVDGQVQAAGMQETYLAAASCGGGCGAVSRKEIADNTQYSDSYNARTNSYQMPSSSYSQTGNASANGSWKNNAAGNSSTWQTTGDDSSTMRSGNASDSAWKKSSGNAGNWQQTTKESADTTTWKRGNASGNNGSTDNTWRKSSGNASSWQTTGTAQGNAWQGNASDNTYRTTPGNASSWQTSGSSQDTNAWQGNSSSNTYRTTPGNAGSWQTTGSTQETSSFRTTPGNSSSWQSATSTPGTPWGSSARGPKDQFQQSNPNAYRTSAYDIEVEVYPNQQRTGQPSGFYEYSRSSSAMGNETITEEELLGYLNPQGRAEYMNLSTQGKAMARQLAAQDNFADKNQAVREAKRRTNPERGMTNR